jgi:WD40 repeat protein
MAKSVNVTITDVAWSHCQTQENSVGDFLTANDVMVSDRIKVENDVSNPFQAVFAVPGDLTMADDSLVAIAGSNGVVLIWRACDLLRQSDSHNRNQKDVLKQYYSHQSGGLFSSSDSIGYPEAVFVEHSKSTKLSWNSCDPTLLLSASYDGTIRLWQRKEKIVSDKDTTEKKKKWSDWIGEVSATLAASDFNGSLNNQTSYSWQCKNIFKPNCGPIRDVKWNTFNEDLFAVVTNDGFLVVYHVLVPHR